MIISPMMISVGMTTPAIQQKKGMKKMSATIGILSGAEQISQSWRQSKPIYDLKSRILRTQEVGGGWNAVCEPPATYHLRPTLASPDSCRRTPIISFPA